MKCLLCGHEFLKEEMKCNLNCPMNKKCNVNCCPNCGYQFVEDSVTIEVFKKLFKRRRKDEKGKN